MDRSQTNGCLGLGVLVGLAGKESRELFGRDENVLYLYSDDGCKG